MSDYTNPVELLYYPKNVKLRNLPPKILEFNAPGSTKAMFAEAQQKQVKYNGSLIAAEVYTVPDYYARKLIAGQPDRYYLINPESIIIKVKDSSGLSSSPKRIFSILKEGMVKSEPITVPDTFEVTKPNEVPDTFEVTEPNEVPDTFEVTEPNEEELSAIEDLPAPDKKDVAPSNEEIMLNQAKTRRNIPAASHIGREPVSRGEGKEGLDLTSSGDGVIPTEPIKATAQDEPSPLERPVVD